MSKRILSLDGLRAIAIILVIVGNLEHTRGFPHLSVSDYVGDYARVGFDIFFVISGFLITLLLMEEQGQSGKISVRTFYLRRALRIMPAFLAFMCAILVANALHWTHISRQDVLAALTFTMNYDVHRTWDVGHLWFLSVEMQFYLLWPLAIAFFGRGKRVLALALAMFLAAPLVRLGMHVVLHGPARDLEIFPAVCDSIAIGCLLALGRDKLTTPAYLRFANSGAVWLLLPVILIINRLDGVYTLASLFGTPVKLIALAIIIERCTRDSSVVGRTLNSQLLVVLGALSYSLYLWQQPFTIDSPALVTNFPFNLLAVFALATMSYLLIERPFETLRARSTATV